MGTRCNVKRIPRVISGAVVPADLLRALRALAATRPLNVVVGTRPSAYPSFPFDGDAAWNLPSE